ncbi:4060_t:CDS:2 [Racocetra fulgida]|uniref:4060_t:CDS:1 n=1 Tax=Racocetra fulgida TaxID=60492 RepID=A0A9N9BZX6_9GLOM|nr:4060_t:CDS:2 [Racocetra fulgida]
MAQKNTIIIVFDYVDDQTTNISLNITEKLAVIRKTLCKKLHTADFDFYNNLIKINRDTEADTDLKSILTNKDTLYISTCSLLNFLKVKIVVNSSDNVKTSISRTLPINENLKKIRKRLNEGEDEILKIGSNGYFRNKTMLISHNDEYTTKLSEILQESNNEFILQIEQKRGLDWTKLIKKFCYGFVFKDDRVEEAPKQAFEVDVDKVVSKKEIKPPDKIDKLEECEFELDTLCKKNFILYGSIKAISPWLSVFLGVSHQESKCKLENCKKSTIYSITRAKRASIALSKESIRLNPDFIYEIEKILDDNESKDVDKLESLREISKKYGHFYASYIAFGGATVKKQINTTKTKTSNVNIAIDTIVHNGSTLETENKTKISGDYKYSVEQIIGDELSENYEDWGIIEYDGINPIFDLLDVKLQKRIKEILEDENVFSLRVDYEDRHSPIILVHLIASKKEKSKKYSTRIGWIVVGYPISFDFDQAEYPVTLKGYSPKISKFNEKRSLYPFGKRKENNRLLENIKKNAEYNDKTIKDKCPFFVYHIFDCPKDCNRQGFINISSKNLIYGSLNTYSLAKEMIRYFNVPPKTK